MSDIKAAFRAAQQARGGTAPSKEQLRALRAAKAAQRGSSAADPGLGPSSQQPALRAQQQSHPVPPTAGRPVAVPSQKGLPEDFFQQPAAKKQAVEAPSTASTSQPTQLASGPGRPGAAAAAPAGSSAARPDTELATALPEGFFTDKAADAKARGVKLPDAADKEREFQEFQRMIDDQLRESAAQEAAEAVEEAEERHTREEFEQLLRMQRLEALRALKSRDASAAVLSAAAQAGLAQEEVEGVDAATLAEAAASLAAAYSDAPSGGAEDDVLKGITLPKKRRVIDTLKQLAGSDDDEDGSDGEGEDDGIMLDWRAKKV